MCTKVKYTYSTCSDRLKKIKLQAVIEDKPVNEILDKLIDDYLKKLSK